MLILHILMFLLTPIRAAPKRHKPVKGGVEDIKWDIIPMDMMACWGDPSTTHQPDVVNWTAISEASAKLQEWGLHHQIGAGDFRGFDVGK